VSTQVTRIVLILILMRCLYASASKYVDYEKQNNRLLERVIEEAVQKTPVWFTKYKQEF